MVTHCAQRSLVRTRQRGIELVPRRSTGRHPFNAAKDDNHEPTIGLYLWSVVSTSEQARPVPTDGRGCHERRPRGGNISLGI